MTDKTMPAFPRPASDAHQHGMHKPQEGMTLRDYFAAKAMQGIAATLIQSDGEPFWHVIATDSYKMADAMMEARK